MFRPFSYTSIASNSSDAATQAEVLHQSSSPELPKGLAESIKAISLGASLLLRQGLKQAQGIDKSNRDPFIKQHEGQLQAMHFHVHLKRLDVTAVIILIVVAIVVAAVL